MLLVSLSCSSGRNSSCSCFWKVVFVCVCACACACVCECVRACVRARVCVNVSVSVRACVRACVRARVSVRACVCARAHCCCCCCFVVLFFEAEISLHYQVLLVYRPRVISQSLTQAAIITMDERSLASCA